MSFFAAKRSRPTTASQPKTYGRPTTTRAYYDSFFTKQFKPSLLLALPAYGGPSSRLRLFVSLVCRLALLG